MHNEQLRALLAVIDTGTFEAAARQLHLTPSAVSQRIKALEHSMGQVVVRRGQPCEPTTAGEVLVRLARQQHLRVVVHGPAQAGVQSLGHGHGADRRQRGVAHRASSKLSAYAWWRASCSVSSGDFSA